MRSAWLVLGLLAALLAGMASAASARLTLKLDRVTLVETLRALQKQSGADFQVAGKPLSELKPDPNAPRASFSWDQTSLGAVCHDVARAFGYVVARSENALADFRKEPLPEKTPHRAIVSGGSFLVTELEKRSRGAVGPDGGFGGTIVVTARPDHADPDLLFALNRTKVTTDLGPARAIPPGEPLFAARGLDEMTLWIPVDRLPPGARKLTLESRLVSYRALRYEHADLPLISPPVTKTAFEPITPAPAPPMEQRCGPVRMQIRRLTHNAVDGTRLEFDAVWPGDVKVSVDALEGTRFADWPVPIIKRRSGQFLVFNVDGRDLSAKPAPAPKKNKEDEEDEAETGPRPEHHVRLWCATDAWDASDPPVAIMWDLAVRTGPPLRIPFKITDIPIPPGAGDEEPAVSPTETGELALPVTLPADGVERELAVGLSRQEGASWGPVRWRTVGLGQGSVARVDGLAPGTYRVLRALLAAGAASGGGGDAPLRRVSGDWENASVTAQVQAGKTVTLPPLKPKQ